MIGRTVRIPFNTVYTATLTAASNVSVNIGTNTFDPLLANIAPNFEYYRFTKLAFIGMPVNQTYAMSYIPSNESSPANTSFANAILAGCNRIVSASETTRTTMPVPKNMLYDSPENWWSTSASSNIPTQGRLEITTPTTVTSTIYIQVFGMVEYKVPTYNTSDARIRSLPVAPNRAASASGNRIESTAQTNSATVMFSSVEDPSSGAIWLPRKM